MQGNSNSPTPLRREVLGPRSDSGGLGIIAVSAAAMIFAVASAALMARTRPPVHQCPAAFHGPVAPSFVEPRLAPWRPQPREPHRERPRHHLEGGVEVGNVIIDW